MLQLELNLWQQLKEAEVAPTLVDFRQLCLSFDAELNQMTAKEKMEQGAEAMVLTGLRPSRNWLPCWQ